MCMCMYVMHRSALHVMIFAIAVALASDIAMAIDLAIILPLLLLLRFLSHQCMSVSGPRVYECD